MNINKHPLSELDRMREQLMTETGEGLQSLIAHLRQASRDAGRKLIAVPPTIERPAADQVDASTLLAAEYESDMERIEKELLESGDTEPRDPLDFVRWVRSNGFNKHRRHNDVSQIEQTTR